jgi:hypothetical protein
MTQPKQRGGRRTPGPGKTMGAPRKERPAGSSSRLLPLWATQEQWDWLLDALPSDTVERTEWVMAKIAEESQP